MREGAANTQTGVLATGRAKGSAGEIEELGRELGLAGAQLLGRLKKKVRGLLGFKKISPRRKKGPLTAKAGSKPAPPSSCKSVENPASRR